MKTTKSILVVLFVLLTAQMASAYYSPSTGRWLSRDPVGELGFQALQETSRQTENSIQQQSGRWIDRDPIGEKDGNNLYCFVRNDSINALDIGGLGTWTHNVNHNETTEIETEVYYVFDKAEKCKCNKAVVDRYVKKLFGIWPGLAGDYYPDSAGGGGFWDPVDKRAYAEGDAPDGPLTIWPIPWHKPWQFGFKWKVRCTEGQSAGNILSTSEGIYYTSGHLSGHGYFGTLYINY